MDAVEGAKIMPPEVVRYFVLRAAPSKRLYFDPVGGVVQLMDEFAAFAANPDKTESEKQLWYICTRGNNENRSVSRVPFSHLVASYQASLKDVGKTLDVIKRTEHSAAAEEDAEIIREELKFIDEWLQRRAPEDVKFSLAEQVSGEVSTYTRPRLSVGSGAPASTEKSWVVAWKGTGARVIPRSTASPGGRWSTTTPARP